MQYGPASVFRVGTGRYLGTDACIGGSPVLPAHERAARSVGVSMLLGKGLPALVASVHKAFAHRLLGGYCAPIGSKCKQQRKH
jgi:hypothetical protein